MTQGKPLAKKALEIIRAAQALKSHAYDEAPNEHAKLKMQELVILVREGQELMEQLTLDLEEEDGRSSSVSDAVPDGLSCGSSGGAAGDSALPPSSP